MPLSQIHSPSKMLPLHHMAALAFAKTSLIGMRGRFTAQTLGIVERNKRNTHLVNLKNHRKMEQKIGQFNDIHFNMYHKNN